MNEIYVLLRKLLMVSFLFVLTFALVFSGIAEDKIVLPESDKNKVKMSWQETTQQLLNSMSDRDRARLKKMQQENPPAFRKTIKSLLKKHKAKQLRLKEKQEMKILLEKYSKAQDEDKVKVLSTITKKVTKQFNRKMLHNKQNIQKTEKRLNELKLLLKSREDNAEQIIQERIKFLIKNPHLRW